MIYCFDVEKIPKIERVYTVVRRTVWQVADPSNILILILEGTCRFEIGTQSSTASPGDAVFIPAGQTYKRSPDGDKMCKMLYLHFKTGAEVLELENEEATRRIMEGVSRADVQLLDEKKNFLAQDAGLYLGNFNTARRSEVLEAGEDISKASVKYGSDNGLYVSFCMCRVLSLISKDLKRSLMAGDMDTDTVKIPGKLKKAVWYVKQNESGRITLDGLCDYCNVSKSQMIRYFKDAFNKTPIQYVNEYKINRSREMIQSTPELAIKNVCDALGFDDQHYFSRIFMKITGESPSAYKYRVVNFGKNDKDKKT